MSTQDERYIIEQEVILNAIEEDEKAQKEAQKIKEMNRKAFMTAAERTHYWALFYPIYYKQKAIEKQFSGNDNNIFFKFYVHAKDKELTSIYNSVNAKDSEILNKYESLKHEGWDISYQMMYEFESDACYSFKTEVEEAVERDLAKENIPLTYIFTPSDEELIDKLYLENIPF